LRRGGVYELDEKLAPPQVMRSVDSAVFKGGDGTTCHREQEDPGCTEDSFRLISRP